MHMFIRANQDSAIYRTNTVYDFTCILPRPLSNASGNVRLAVKELIIAKHYLTEGVFLLTIDAVHPSPVFGKEFPATCCFTLNSQGRSSASEEVIQRVALGPTPNYFKVLHNSVTRLRIQLKKDLLSAHSRTLSDDILIKQIYIVLHFKS